MRKPAIVIDAERTVSDAVKLMEDSGCAFLPVVRDGGVIGAITDRDIAVRCTGQGLDPAKTSVEETMSKPVRTIHEDFEPEDAAVMMRLHQLRRLVVIQSRGEPVGVVTLVDLAGRLPDETISETLHTFAHPVHDGPYRLLRKDIPGLYTG